MVTSNFVMSATPNNTTAKAVTSVTFVDSNLCLHSSNSALVAESAEWPKNSSKKEHFVMRAKQGLEDLLVLRLFMGEHPSRSSIDFTKDVCMTS